MENPRKRVNDGSDQTDVIKKLKHLERIQEKCVKEKVCWEFAYSNAAFWFQN